MYGRLKSRINILKKIVPYSEGVKLAFFINAIVGLLVMAVSLLDPIFYSLFIEKVILGGKLKYIYVVAFGYLIMNIILIILSYIQNHMTNLLINTVTFRLRKFVLNTWLNEKFGSYDNFDIGDKKMIIDQDINNMSAFAGNQSSEYFINIIKSIVLIISMAIIEWRLLLFSLIIIPLTFYSDYLISKKEEKPKLILRENDKNWGEWLHSTISNWREVRILNMRKSEEKRFIVFSHNDAIMYSEWNNYWVTRRLVIPQIKDVFLMQFSLYLLGGIMILKDNLSIGQLLIFIQYYSLLSSVITQISMADADIVENQIYANKVLDEITSREDGVIKPDKEIFQSDNYELVMDNVSFNYPKSEKEIISNFSLIIQKGERVAITGESGSGKTTILKLLFGLLEPTKGNVKYSGYNILDINVSSLHEKVGFVMQENILFNTTILENFYYANQNATQSEIEDACKKACIYDFIMQLPQKFDTVIGEKGIKLSGGQRQRIVLARLFLKDIEVFVFDEATSAIDPYSENIIHNAIEAIGKDKTMIVVSHRQSSIKLCDRIIEVF